MKTERDIEALCGKDRPFTVPEGYFESLTERVMSNLPETGKVVALPAKTHIHWLQWTSVAAACVAAFVLITQYMPVSTASEMQADVKVVYDEQYQEDMMEYAMVDANDVYAYLSGEY